MNCDESYVRIHTQSRFFKKENDERNWDKKNTFCVIQRTLVSHDPINRVSYKRVSFIFFNFIFSRSALVYTVKIVDFSFSSEELLEEQSFTSLQKKNRELFQIRFQLSYCFFLFHKYIKNNLYSTREITIFYVIGISRLKCFVSISCILLYSRALTLFRASFSRVSDEIIKLSQEYARTTRCRRLLNFSLATHRGGLIQLSWFATSIKVAVSILSILLCLLRIETRTW